METGWWSQGDDIVREIIITEENSKLERASEAMEEEGTLSVSEITITGENSTPERDLGAKEEKGHPHQFQSILRESDSPAIRDHIPLERLYDQLCAGFFLKSRTMKYWVEKNSKKNCFMIYARGLSITWAENDLYWQWVTPKDAPSNEAPVEMAELLNVCWLEARGRFDVSKLSPGTTYEAVFVILLRSSGYGWEVPVNFRATFPGGTKQERKENLREKPRGKWIEIKAGEVSTSEYKEGEMEVSMFEYGGHWKRGLVLKGVLIRPKN